MRVPENHNEATEQIIGCFYVCKTKQKLLLSNQISFYEYKETPIDEIQGVNGLTPFNEKIKLVRAKGVDFKAIGYVVHEGQKYIITDEPKIYHFIDTPLEDIRRTSQLTPYIDRRKNHVVRYLIDMCKEKRDLSKQDKSIFNQIVSSLKKTYRKKDERPRPDLPSNHDLNREKTRKNVTMYSDFKEKAEGVAKEEGINFNDLVEKAIKFYVEEKRGYSFD